MCHIRAIHFSTSWSCESYQATSSRSSLADLWVISSAIEVGNIKGTSATLVRPNVPSVLLSGVHIQTNPVEGNPILGSFKWYQSPLVWYSLSRSIFSSSISSKHFFICLSWIRAPHYHPLKKKKKKAKKQARSVFKKKKKEFTLWIGGGRGSLLAEEKSSLWGG